MQLNVISKCPLDVLDPIKIVFLLFLQKHRYKNTAKTKTQTPIKRQKTQKNTDTHKIKVLFNTPPRNIFVCGDMIKN